MWPCHYAPAAPAFTRPSLRFSPTSDWSVSILALLASRQPGGVQPRARPPPPARPEPRPAQGPSGAGWAAGGRRSRSVGATVLSGITVPLPAPAASFLRPLGPACGPGPKAFPTDGPAHSLSGQAALALGHRLSADPGLLALGRAVLRTLSGSARDTGPARVRRLSAGQRGWECRWQGGGVAYLEGLSLPRATFWANSKACRSGPLPGAGEGGGGRRPLRRAQVRPSGPHRLRPCAPHVSKRAL